MAATRKQKQLAYDILIGMLQGKNDDEQDELIAQFLEGEKLSPTEELFQHIKNYLDGNEL